MKNILKANTSLRHVFALLMVIFFCSVAYAGSSNEVEEEDDYDHIKEEALDEFYQHQYFSALIKFNKLLELSPQQSFEYERAICLFNTRHFKESRPMIKKMMLENTEYSNSLNFYWGILSEYEHRYDVAIEYFILYVKQLNSKKDNYKTIVSDVEHRIEECQKAKKIVVDSVSVCIKNIGNSINTRFPEYAPVLTKSWDTLFFTSARPSTTGGEMDMTDGVYNEDVYYSVRTNDVWAEPKKIKGDVDWASNESFLDISNDGKKALVYRYSNDMSYVHSSGEVFEVNLQGDSCFGMTKISKKINSKGWESSASYSPTGIWFSSERHKGFGGTDIYFVERLNSVDFGKPVLMEKVNTAYNEDSPMIWGNDEVLFYASNGDNTIGGYDIFYIKKGEDGKWGNPVNMGYPINTAHDELFFEISDDAKKMFFSSDRENGYGDQDIFYIETDVELFNLRD